MKKSFQSIALSLMLVASAVMAQQTTPPATTAAPVATPSYVKRVKSAVQGGYTSTKAALSNNLPGSLTEAKNMVVSKNGAYAAAGLATVGLSVVAYKKLFVRTLRPALLEMTKAYNMPRTTLEEKTAAQEVAINAHKLLEEAVTASSDVIKNALSDLVQASSSFKVAFGTNDAALDVAYKGLQAAMDNCSVALGHAPFANQGRIRNAMDKVVDAVEYVSNNKAKTAAVVAGTVLVAGLGYKYVAPAIASTEAYKYVAGKADAGYKSVATFCKPVTDKVVAGRNYVSGKMSSVYASLKNLVTTTEEVKQEAKDLADKTNELPDKTQTVVNELNKQV